MVDPGMTRTAPSGTRDVLPDEMRELRAITRAMVDCLDGAGYGEVRTPTLEYEHSQPAGIQRADTPYRLLDEHGDSLVLRSDMTLPIARIAATRYGSDRLPLKLCYLARAWRRVKIRSGDPREILQLGAELIGAGEAGDGELLTVLGDVLAVSGLREWRIALGDVRIAGELLDLAGVAGSDRSECINAIAAGDLARLRGFDRSAQSVLGLPLSEALALRSPANGQVSELGSALPSAAAELMEKVAGLPEELRDRVIVDFSLAPRLDYYGGLVFEIYDPAVGRALGGGGRYDAVVGSFGLDTSAIGFALDADLVHAALAGEERGEA